MDTELINMYIGKQRDTLNDLMNKAIMLETRLQLAEDRLGKVQEEKSQLEEQAKEAMNNILAERDQLKTKISLLEQQLDKAATA